MFRFVGYYSIKLFSIKHLFKKLQTFAFLIIAAESVSFQRYIYEVNKNIFCFFTPPPIHIGMAISDVLELAKKNTEPNEIRVQCFV